MDGPRLDHVLWRTGVFHSATSEKNPTRLKGFAAALPRGTLTAMRPAEGATSTETPSPETTLSLVLPNRSPVPTM